MPGFERTLARAWVGGLAATALAQLLFFKLWAIPLVGLVALPFLPLPTLLLYATPALLVYAAVYFLLWHRRGLPGLPARVAVLSVLVTLSVGVGWRAAHEANDRSEALLAARSADPMQPITLPPVERVALIRLSGHFESDPRCDAFCVSLLRSGQAREVLVATARTNTVEPQLPMPGRRYRLAEDARGCVREQDSWKWFAGQPVELARMTGGFDAAMSERFGNCVRGEPAAVDAADVTFVDAMPDTTPQTRLGLDWSLAPGRVLGEIRVVAQGRLLYERLNHIVWRYSAPLLIDPLTGNAASGAGPGQFRREDVSGRLQAYAAPGDWWAAVANAEEIHQAAIAPAP